MNAVSRKLILASTAFGLCFLAQAVLLILSVNENEAGMLDEPSAVLFTVGHGLAELGTLVVLLLLFSAAVNKQSNKKGWQLNEHSKRANYSSASEPSCSGSTTELTVSKYGAAAI